MPLEAVAIDVDGTLLTSQHTISPSTRSAIALARAAGIVVVLASARGPLGLEAIGRTLGLDGPVIAFNGALVYNAKKGAAHKVLFERRLRYSTARHLTMLADDFGLEIAWHSANACYARRIGGGLQREAQVTGQSIEQWTDDVREAPHKLLAIAHTAGQMTALKTLRAAVPWDCRAEASHRNYLEITASGLDKASAMTRLAAVLRIRLRDVAAIGDGENDMRLLRLAGIGVAMGHAPVNVRRAADWVDRNERRRRRGGRAEESRCNPFRERGSR